MLLLVIITIAISSVILALWSLWRQNKIEELQQVKKELKRNRILFQKKSL